MILAFLLMVFLGVSAVALIGLEDSHYRFTRFLEELDERAAQRSDQQASAPLEDSLTHSLLALSKVDSPVPCDSPVPESALSSSLVSVPHDQLKNRGSEL
jgi:hypothetical protein